MTSLVGRRFGRLVVMARVASAAPGRRWSCSCDCGSITEVTTSNLQRSTMPIRSCGCISREASRTRKTRLKHGHTSRTSQSPTHSTWSAAIARCTNPKNKDFAHYGGRGITVCDRWLHSFENFLADMGERPSGKTIDRIDNARGYEPGNCRWSTQQEQMLNTSCTLLSLDDRRSLQRRADAGETMRELALAFSISTAAARAMVRRSKRI